MAFSHLIGPTAACYGDDDPTERLMIFMAGGTTLLRVSLDHETAELVDVSVPNRWKVVPFSAAARARLLEERAEQVARIVDFFGLPADFAA